MGLEDVRVDRFGILTATVPANGAAVAMPTVGLLAHVDTSPAGVNIGFPPRPAR